MELFSTWLDILDSYLGGAFWFPVLLLFVGFGFTVYLSLPQVRFFSRAWRIFLGRESRNTDPGDTTHFQALSTALSGTIGTGNIGGVAFALFLGGPAALFWMWATAFFGMTTKFVEVTIAHKYRQLDDRGEMVGGAMVFLEKRLNMKWLAVVFAVATLITCLGTGSLPQSRSMSDGIQATFNIDPWITSLVMGSLLTLVVIGGIRRIAAVTSVLVPFMGVVYAFCAIAVLISNMDQVWPSFVLIFDSAFTGSAAVGGFLGAGFAYAFKKGVSRGLFSNEAGQGSAAIAHASAKTDHPVPEGMVSLLEPFIDTLCICTLTGLVILASGVWSQKFENEFVHGDHEFVARAYIEERPQHVQELRQHFDELVVDVGYDPLVQILTKEVAVQNGLMAGLGEDYTLLHNRSIAEEVKLYLNDELYTGNVNIIDGKIDPRFTMVGKSLIHSVPLTVEAYKQSFLGPFGPYMVAIGLLLFAFSTSVAWCYYGDRAVTYLAGTRWLLFYRIMYCTSFFIAAFVDTTLIWKLAAVCTVLMALPNLVGITLLAFEMRAEVKDFLSRPRVSADE